MEAGSFACVIISVESYAYGPSNTRSFKDTDKVSRAVCSGGHERDGVQ